MKAMVDLYAYTYLTAMGVPVSRRHQPEGEEFPEPDGERPAPTPLLSRIKGGLARLASGLRRFEFRLDRYGMADWWVGF